VLVGHAGIVEVFLLPLRDAVVVGVSGLHGRTPL
jgi:hypothetical protein